MSKNSTQPPPSGRAIRSEQSQLSHQDSWVVKLDPSELARRYRRAESALNSAEPGTSREEWSELKMGTARTLRALQDVDKDGWEARVFGDYSPRVSCAPGTEPISGKSFGSPADSCQSAITVKPSESKGD